MCDCWVLCDNTPPSHSHENLRPSKGIRESFRRPTKGSSTMSSRQPMCSGGRHCSHRMIQPHPLLYNWQVTTFKATGLSPPVYIRLTRSAPPCQPAQLLGDPVVNFAPHSYSFVSHKVLEFHRGLDLKHSLDKGMWCLSCGLCGCLDTPSPLVNLWGSRISMHSQMM